MAVAGASPPGPRPRLGSKKMAAASFAWSFNFPREKQFLQLRFERRLFRGRNFSPNHDLDCAPARASQVANHIKDFVMVSGGILLKYGFKDSTARGPFQEKPRPKALLIYWESILYHGGGARKTLMLALCFTYRLLYCIRFY